MDCQASMDLNESLDFFNDVQDDGFSGEESFLTDEELDYQDGLDPAEDGDNEEDTSPPTQTSQESSHSFAEEDPSTPAAESQEPPGIDHGRMQSRKRARSRSRSRSGSSRGRQSPESTRSRSRSPQPAAPTPSWKSEPQPDIPPDPKSGDNEEDTSPPTQTSKESSHSSAEEDPSTPAAESQEPPGIDHGRMQSRSRKRARLRSRSRSGSPESTSSRSRSPQPAAPTPSWKSELQPDIPPDPKRFVPTRKPGHQLNSTSTYTALNLFKLFVSESAAIIMCNNTNKNAAKNIANGKKYLWKNLTVEEFFKYVGLTFYFALLRLSNIRNYWRTNTIFSHPFPPSVMTRDRYQVISWNIHMSDPDEDVQNDQKKGTPAYDRLFRLKPLLNDVQQACRAFYHPRQNLSVDERMVATKAHTGMTQYIKAKPTKWGFKLFVLADSSTGYTLDFAVYTGKSAFASGLGLAYDSVMSLLNKSSLGSGYHLYVDNFYTSPKLFMDLHNMNFGACGTYRDNMLGSPRATKNAMTKKDPRGTIRWIRDGPLVFVKWMDAREVSICSTIHPAFSGNTVERRVRRTDGSWKAKSIPCPTPITEYNKNMGGVDLSDQLIQYYSVHHKTMRWYRTLFFHFLDIAATNSYLLHKEVCAEKQQQPMTHRAFLEELTAQLCSVTVAVAPTQQQSNHVPVPISDQTETSKKASYGRRQCVNCKQKRQAKQATPWKCKACDVALCVIPDRNCFEAWHQ
ncbi:piggyBac transposable element-derived protein 4-like isoform X3 [Pimephales promelas]|uniref:piggyBac transposable element-derived protein 4-like isoform X3 n=1 Tax=Pimephales promelas TaxID=90988 RepID=UPI001955A399|nr:piggyBac transposable element-derived protein 4-like isoform X3 [Pimephales promelas]